MAWLPHTNPSWLLFCEPLMKLFSWWPGLWLWGRGRGQQMGIPRPCSRSGWVVFWPLLVSCSNKAVLHMGLCTHHTFKAHSGVAVGGKLQVPRRECALWTSSAMKGMGLPCASCCPHFCGTSKVKLLLLHPQQEMQAVPSTLNAEWWGEEGKILTCPLGETGECRCRKGKALVKSSPTISISILWGSPHPFLSGYTYKGSLFACSQWSLTWIHSFM